MDIKAAPNTLPDGALLHPGRNAGCESSASGTCGASGLVRRGLTAGKGFALLEALVAVAIFSIALLGLMKTQAVSIKNSADAEYRADATNLADQIISAMWVDRSNLVSYAYRNTEAACSASTIVPAYTAVSNWMSDVESVLPGVKASATSSLKPQIVVDTTSSVYTTVKVTLCWAAPGDSQTHSHVATAQINN